MKRFQFLTKAGINYISYKKEKLYRYVAWDKVCIVNGMPDTINDKKWHEFEKSLNERLCNIINKNSINSGLKGLDLDAAIISIRDWIMELQDSTVDNVDNLTSLPDRKEMLEEIYNIIKGIINFAKEQKKNYTFEQEWKEIWW